MKHNYNLLICFNAIPQAFNTFLSKQKKHSLSLFVFIFTLLGFSNAFGQSPFIDNNVAAPNSFTVPAGVTSITIELWGGGGAGGGSSTNDLGGSGGGSGGYTTRTYTGLLGGEVINYTLGAGGTGTSTTGNPGGNSTLTFNTFTLTANGGGGGGANIGLVGAGGTASGGTTNTIGNTGLLGTTSGGNGGNAPSAGGTGGTGGLNSVGGTGNAPGGGGGGGERTGGGSNGGAGGSGGIKITFTCPSNTPSAGSNQTLAGCATSTTLAGSAIPSGMTGTWTVISGTATITNPNSPTSTVTGLALPATNGGTATATLRWTIDNGRCGSSFSDVTITTSRGPGCYVYCTAGGTTNTVGHISNVTFNTINRNSTFDGYINTGLTTNVFKGLSYNLSISKDIAAAFLTYTQVWIDFNNDGDFADAGEIVMPSLSTTVAGVSTRTLSVTIPAGATNGITRMRVMMKYNAAPSADGCDTGTIYMDVEDYYVNILTLSPCTTPTAQPTALNLTPAGTSITGSFTAASPISDSYLVVISTLATPPSAPVNGTSYAIGSSLASGYIVVDNDTNTTFTAGGLNNNTTYYFYIFSFNGLCSGGPLYNTTSPLIGNTTTTGVVPTYCSGVNPSSSTGAVYISTIRSVGTINDVSNVTGYSAGGYGNFSGTTIATQVAGSGINLEIILAGTYSNPPCNGSSSQFIKTWVDWNKDGDFDDAGEEVYMSGTPTTPIATAIDNIYGFIVPPGTFPGNYRMRIRTRAFCDASLITSCGALPTGETEDYTIAIIEDCPSKILTVTNGSACGPTNTVTLNATKTASATGFRWYANLTGGAPLATTATGTWTTPSISVTTTYYVTAYDGVCETIHRTPVVATILPTTNITVTPSVPEVCGEGNVVQISATGDFVTETLLLQNFESGMAPFTVTTPVNTNGGADTPWNVKTSVYVPSATTVWRPALNSGAIGTTGNKFAFTTSDYQSSNIQTIMTSPVINASLYTSLTLTFDQMYGAFSGDTAIIQAFNGATWTTIATYTGTDIGTPSVFTKMPAINLNAYAGNPNLQIRFVYTAQWDDGWAVDNIKVEGIRPLNTTFTWTGGTVNAFVDAALTTPYVSQSVTTVYVVPTAMQLAAPSWSFTANATLGNGCPVSQLITINNKTKLWKGTSDNNWYNPNNWEPVGVPDANTCVFIYPGSPAANTSNINIAANDAFARTLTVRPSGVLNIHPGNDLTVTDAVTVDAGGTFNIENSGSLIQVNNVANTGNILMKRNVNVRKLDYVYWSSPVANFGLSNISTTSYRYKWIPTIAGNVNGYGNWTTANETMVLGKGYIVRGPNSYTTTLQNYTANFTGVPNNGIINMPISRGTYNGIDYSTGVSTTLATRDDDNWNLIGNPYPSAVNANTFLATNTNIAGFIKYWTHGTTPSTAISDPFYNNYAQNYTVADYVTYNATGANPALGSGNIAAGQGFFVLMNHTSAATTENVVFNNSMRRNDYRNDLFFRTTDSAAGDENEEKHRIWLNLISPSSTSSTTLLGYVTGATNSIDRMYDAPALGVKTNFELYSIENVDKLNIQGRALPFNNEDRIPLGVTISQNGIHTIGISTVDGLFESADQAIFLEDNLLGITHDLRSAPYSFTATIGTNENRFVLKFNNETLGSEDFNSDSVTVFTNDFININAANQTIKSVKVFDLLGKVIGNFNNVDATTFTSKNIAKTQTALLVEVTLENGNTKTYKVIY